MNIIEYFFDCPHCGEKISMLLDLSVLEQSYIEDCEICCHPIEICVQAGSDGLSFFSAQ